MRTAFSFAEIIEQLNNGLAKSDNFAFAMARNYDTPEDYLLNQFLPDTKKPNWNISGVTISLVTTLLQPMAMDGKPAPMGTMSTSEFSAKIEKIGGAMFFNEAQQRELMEMSQSIMGQVSSGMTSIDNAIGDLSINPETGLATNPYSVNGSRLNAILMLNKAIRKSHNDTREYLRGRVLTKGKLQTDDFSAFGIQVTADYGLKSTSIRPARTGNNAWKGSTSKFWEDIRYLKKKFGKFTLVMNSDTFYSAKDNPVNQIVSTNFTETSWGGKYRLVKYDGSKVNPIAPDTDDQVEIVVYNKYGSVLKAGNKTAGTEPELQNKYFIQDGEWFAVGELNQETLMLAGQNYNPENKFALGYTHLAPTVEGGGVSGEYSRIYTPVDRPTFVLAETYANYLPVIVNRDKLVIGSTEI